MEQAKRAELEKDIALAPLAEYPIEDPIDHLSSLKEQSSTQVIAEKTSHDLESGKSSGSTSSLHDQGDSHVDATRDPNIVDWDGPNDPMNPLKWTQKKKWTLIATVSAVTFITPLGSTIFAPAVPLVMKEFHSTNEELAGFVVSVYILGFVVGPLIVAPLSELYGRARILHISNIIFVIFNIACAVSTNIPMFIVFRFIIGCAGSTPLTIGGGVIADVTVPEQRGAAMAIWAMGPLVGPVVGPIIGGFMAETTGWRWIFWLVTIVGAVATVAALIFIRETYSVTILQRKTERLRKETGNMQLRSALDNGQTTGQLFRKSIVRPTKMLFLSPIVFLLALDMAITYGYLYLLFTTFTYVFEDQYGFNSGEAGLTYLGIGLGMFIGLFAAGATSDRLVKKLKAKNGGVLKPEYRLPALIPGAFFVPIGLFWFGWAAEAHVHWIVPIIGTFFFGLGMISTFMPISTYLVDAYTLYAASAMAAVSVLRSLFGAVLPLAGQAMYCKLGLGWGSSLLGFIAIAMIPVPFLFIKYGERIRTSKRFQLDL